MIAALVFQMERIRLPCCQCICIQIFRLYSECTVYRIVTLRVLYFNLDVTDVKGEVRETKGTITVTSLAKPLDKDVEEIKVTYDTTKTSGTQLIILCLTCLQLELILACIERSCTDH